MWAGPTASATRTPSWSPRPNFASWRADNERLETFRSRNAAFAWMRAILAAMEHAESLGAGAAAQARPEPTVTFDDRLELTIGGRDLVLFSTPGGETTDSLVIWLPDESRTALTGNLFGPLFGHVPNLVTMRGDRYRDAADLHRLAGPRPRPARRTGCSPAISTPSTAPTASPPRSRPCATPRSGCTTAPSTA